MTIRAKIKNKNKATKLLAVVSHYRFLLFLFFLFSCGKNLNKTQDLKEEQALQILTDRDVKEETESSNKDSYLKTLDIRPK